MTATSLNPVADAYPLRLRAPHLSAIATTSSGSTAGADPIGCVTGPHPHPPRTGRCLLSVQRPVLSTVGDFRAGSPAGVAVTPGSPYPSPALCVDQADVLGVGPARITEVLRADERATTDEIAVAVIHTTGGVPIETWTTGLFNAWGWASGRRTTGCCWWWPSTTGGCASSPEPGWPTGLPDAAASEIVEGTITPLVRAYRTRDGVLAGLDAIRISLDTTRPATARWPGRAWCRRRRDPAARRWHCSTCLGWPRPPRLAASSYGPIAGARRQRPRRDCSRCGGPDAVQCQPPAGPATCRTRRSTRAPPARRTPQTSATAHPAAVVPRATGRDDPQMPPAADVAA